MFDSTSGIAGTNQTEPAGTQVATLLEVPPVPPLRPRPILNEATWCVSLLLVFLVFFIIFRARREKRAKSADAVAFAAQKPQHRKPHKAAVRIKQCAAACNPQTIASGATSFASLSEIEAVLGERHIDLPVGDHLLKWHPALQVARQARSFVEMRAARNAGCELEGGRSSFELQYRLSPMLRTVLVLFVLLHGVGASETFSTITISATGDFKYFGAAAVGTKVYFAPCSQDNVGVIDATTDTFSTITISVTGNYKYSGAAALGTKVYLAPKGQDNVGVIDATTDTFSTITISVTGTGGKYSGAAALGTKVYLATDYQDNVGVVALPGPAPCP